MTLETNNTLWAEMMAEPKPHRIVPLPKINPKTGEPWGEVAVVMLTAEESALVTREAEVKTKKALKEVDYKSGDMSIGYKDLYQRYCAEGILYYSIKNPDDLGAKFFPKKESIFQLFTVDEVAILLNHYYTVQTELGPIISELTKDDAEAWIKRLTESGSEGRFLLNSLSQVAMTDLIVSLVSQLGALQMGKLLLGTQQENTT